MTTRILTCVYCGHEYPQDTPAHGNNVLTEHIKVCEQHPMRKAESDIRVLRAALVGILGGECTKEELLNLSAITRTMPAPEADKTVMLNAIDALLVTMPNPA